MIPPDVRRDPTFVAMAAACRAAIGGDVSPFRALADLACERDVPEDDPEVLALRGIEFPDLSVTPRVAETVDTNDGPGGDESSFSWLGRAGCYLLPMEPWKCAWGVILCVTNNQTWPHRVLPCWFCVWKPNFRNSLPRSDGTNDRDRRQREAKAIKTFRRWSDCYVVPRSSVADLEAMRRQTGEATLTRDRGLSAARREEAARVVVEWDVLQLLELRRVASELPPTPASQKRVPFVGSLRELVDLNLFPAAPPPSAINHAGDS